MTTKLTRPGKTWLAVKINGRLVRDGRLIAPNQPRDAEKLLVRIQNLVLDPAMRSTAVVVPVEFQIAETIARSAGVLGGM